MQRRPLLLLLCTAALAPLAQVSASDGPLSPSPESSSPHCDPAATCGHIMALPLQQWGLERGQAADFALPWGQSYPFAPVDYPARADSICNCLAAGAEEPGERGASRRGWSGRVGRLHPSDGPSIAGTSLPQALM